MLKILILILIPLSFSFSQSNYYHFLLLQKNGTRIEGNYGHFNNQNFEGIGENGDTVSVNKNLINKLYKLDGNKSFLMGVLGFLVGTVFGLAIISHNYSGTVQNPAPIVLGCSAAGGLIGAIVGSTTHDWELVPLSENKK